MRSCYVLDVTTRNFSRRDLLQLGGKLAMTIGAAKLVIMLPGCGGGGGSGGDDGGSGDPLGPDDILADDGYHHIDDCHSFGTYHRVTRKVHDYYYYTNDYYYSNALACHYDAYFYTKTAYIDCYRRPGFIAGYNYFCFSDYTYDSTYSPR